MADNVEVSAGSGTTIAADEITDGTLGTVKVQYVKIMDGVLESSVKLKIVAEDAAHSSGDGGIMFLAVRKDTATALAGADGDYIPLIAGSDGSLWVRSTDLATLAGAVSGSEIQADVVTLPADPLGANADAAATAGSTGSLSAKLRLITSQLDSIKTAVETLDNTVGGAELQVDIVSGAVSLTGNLPDTSGGALAAIKTAIEIIDNAIAGNEMQVDVLTLPALAAGTNNIGDVDVLTIAAGDNNIGNVDLASAIPAGTNNIGDVDVLSVAIPTTFYMGQKAVTTAGTEVALASSQAILSGVTIKALHANTGWIYVGTNPVTSTTGFVLDAGEQVFIEVANLATVYIDSSVNGEGVSYIGS